MMVEPFRHLTPAECDALEQEGLRLLQFLEPDQEYEISFGEPVD
jgi:hypothetical protein